MLADRRLGVDWAVLEYAVVEEVKMACSAADERGGDAVLVRCGCDCCLTFGGGGGALSITLALPITPPSPPAFLRLFLSILPAAAMAARASRNLFSREIRSKQSDVDTRRRFNSP